MWMRRVTVLTALLGTLLLVLIQTREPAGQASRPARIGGRPNLNGVWQALNEANWDLEAHAARPGMVTQPGVYPNYDFARVPAAPVLALGAAGGVPGSAGVVAGDGRIPYKPEALKKKQENAANWLDRDPELKCYLPGLPRAMYMPYPFQIVQGDGKINMQFEFSNATRTIFLEKADRPPFDAWMGFSAGKWDGDTLVVTADHFTDKSWFDRAGNFHSDQLRLTERFTPLSDDAMNYEVTIEDPQTFTQPWKISMPLYRRLEANAQLIEYRCTEYVEELLLGMLRRKPLVTHWEGETMTIDIKRKSLPPAKLYEWQGR
jgi:hypothetical protein